jgi:hypothetical protein
VFHDRFRDASRAVDDGADEEPRVHGAAVRPNDDGVDAFRNVAGKQ